MNKRMLLHFLAGAGMGICVLIFCAKLGAIEDEITVSPVGKEEMKLVVADELTVIETTDSTMRVSFDGDSKWGEYWIAKACEPDSFMGSMLQAGTLRVTLSHQEYAEMLLEVGQRNSK